MIARRRFICTSLALAAAPTLSLSQPQAMRQRIDARDFFANESMRSSFTRGVAKLRSNPNRRDVNAWTYWWFVHWLPPGVSRPDDMSNFWTQCPHHQPYFLVWHRAYLAAFESILRIAANDPTLNLPYWDYFDDGAIPDVFLKATLDNTKNPLLPSGKPRTQVTVDAVIKQRPVAFVPFDNEVTSFESDAGPNSFERLLEGSVHDMVHDEVGGSLSDPRTAVDDPLFWLHHANIDRLWVVWTKLGGDRAMQPPTSAYWTVPDYTFSSKLRTKVSSTISTEQMGYQYAQTSAPSFQNRPTPPRPPVIQTEAATTNAGKLMSVETMHPLQLTNQSVSINLPVPQQSRAFLQDLSSSPPKGTKTVRALTLILDGATVEETEKSGGVSYDIYLNLPTQSQEADGFRRYFIGSLSGFSLQASHTHHQSHGVIQQAESPKYDLTLLLRAQAGSAPIDLNNINISFVRVGRTSQNDRSIRIRKIRIVDTDNEKSK